MNIPDYNIELAHIYADKKIEMEQIESFRIGANLIKELRKDRKTFTISVLIDDYNVSSFNIKKEDIIGLAQRYEIDIDSIVYESTLDIIANQLVKELISDNLKVENFSKFGKSSLILATTDKKIGIRDYFENSHRNTCSFLIASWQLCRLGVYNLSDSSILKFSDKPFIAKKTITILPGKYRSNENKALSIIKNTPYGDLLSNIEYLFFEEAKTSQFVFAEYF